MSFETINQTSNSGVTNSKKYLDNRSSSLLKLKSAKGIAGFLFDVPDQDSLNIDYDITDHFTESNSFLNDHKVKKPIIITLSGFKGENVYRAPEGAEGAVQEVSNRLEIVDAYLGELTPGALQTAQRAVQQTQSAISAINQTIDKTQNIVSFFDGEGPEETEQQKAYRELKSLGEEVLLTVQTPWDFFDNMTIKSISLTQGGETNDITDIAVTLKEMRIAEIKVVDYDQNQFPIREEVQSGVEEDQGNIRGTEENVSFLFQVFGGE